MTRKVTVEAPAPQPQMMGGFFYQPPNYREESKKKQVEVTIPRGSHPGQSVVLSGEMDFDSHDSPPGDLIFKLQPRPHRTFTRKGHDLALKMTISLQEAMCGCTRTIRHLDGRTLVVESAKHAISTAASPKNAVNTEDTSQNATTVASEEEDNNSSVETPASVYIQSGDVQVLKGKGMPKNPQGTAFGDLYIQYAVELPKKGSTERLTTAERKELARLLEKLEGNSSPRKANSAPSASSNQQPAGRRYTLKPAKLSDFGRASGPVPTMADDDHQQQHADDHQQRQQQFQFPFGGGAGRQFFFSSTGGSPFSDQDNDYGDEDNAQCRQM